MTFDIIVIGSGIGGLLAAKELSKGGKKTAVIENCFFGGAVYNVGSTRKKELVTLAQHFFLNKQYQKHYIVNSIEKLDWQQAMEWIDSLEEGESKQHQQELKKVGVTTIYGKATFVSPHEISVDGIHYKADQFIIATGAKTRPFSFLGHEFLSDSTDFLTQKEIPKRILLMGAGIISFAFMTIATAFGCEVTVVQHDDLALKNFDQEFVSQLIEINKKRGVNFFFNDQVTRIDKDDKTLTVRTKNGQRYEVDKIYNVCGRIPEIEELDLDKAGVLYETKGIITDDYLKTNQSHIYACGDCSNADVPKLANYAAYQSNYIASAILQQNFSKIHYPIESMSIFSDPKIAQVGVTTQEALLNPEEYTVNELDISDWLDSKRKIETVALMKTVIRNSDNHLVGATAISHDADLLINYITLGLNTTLSKNELAQQLFAYPSLINELTRFWK